MTARGLLRDLRHYGGYILDQAALGVFQAVAITVDKVMDSRAPVDGSRERARIEALVAAGKLAEAEEQFEVWESESDWLGNEATSLDAAEDPLYECGRPSCGCHEDPRYRPRYVSAASASAESGPSEVSADPPGPSDGPSLAEWLVPAICEVLAEHEPATFENQTRVSCGDSVGAHHYQSFPDQQAWREHVAGHIAERVANLLPLIQPQ